ncbi:MAG: hypothetical protein ACP59X_13105 [Solidesulfovibrio sp. DCME]|uniref:hypothetical protein n=1 Tax=Solidesulfovibrio sp. DCME TaxID=3447380 RepID=UPI003D0A71D7
MPGKVLVIDTSILCVWLKLPGLEHCGSDHDRWDHARVATKLRTEAKNKATFVLPLATIIETGNHISQSGGDRKPLAEALGDIMRRAADSSTPWAAFGDQSELWSPEKLHLLAATWPPLAAQKLSLGDATIKEVAAYYAKAGYTVELLTGDQGLKAWEPPTPPLIPRRRRH